mgnify:CR=1 FL=1
MKITEKEVEYVAKLARLYVSDEEKAKLTKDMSAIIEFADTLSKIDTDGVAPAAHAIPVQNVFREDVVKDSYKRDDILKNAPEKEAGCFSVPKVVE